VRIDRSDDGDERPDAGDVPGARGADAGRDAGPDRGAAADHRGAGPPEQDGASRDDDASTVRIARNLEYRATVDAVNRACAIDPGRARVQGIDERPDAADASGVHGADARRNTGPDRDLAGKNVDHGAEAGGADRARNVEHQGTAKSVDSARAIDQGYARVREIEEKTVTPAMRRVEAEDPSRHLAGLENRLKGEDRLAEKITEAVEERGHTVGEAFGLMKDVIRYTFCYPDDRYTDGVYADCGRLEDAGFERYDRRNSWEQAEYKGINSRWQVPGGGQIFEVQFHTQASLGAKEETHWAYERLRSLPEDEDEVRELHAYQREVTSKVPIPPGAPEIPDYP
jgi:hypothetical protein